MFVRAILSFSNIVIFHIDYLPDSCYFKHGVLGVTAQVLATGDCGDGLCEKRPGAAHAGHAWSQLAPVDP